MTGIIYNNKYTHFNLTDKIKILHTYINATGSTGKYRRFLLYEIVNNLLFGKHSR